MRRQELTKGLIGLHVLHHAVEGEIYGLEMIVELRRHGYDIGPGTLYPLLHRMEQSGYLQSVTRNEGGRIRRKYRATRAGKTELTKAKKQVHELFSELFEHDS